MHKHAHTQDAVQNVQTLQIVPSDLDKVPFCHLLLVQVLHLNVIMFP